jgi:hypothetical protein
MNRVRAYHLAFPGPLQATPAMGRHAPPAPPEADIRQRSSAADQALVCQRAIWA